MGCMSNIAILGGGIAGPALAIALHKHGIKSTIYEGRGHDYDLGGSLVITANGARVLDHLGVYKQVHAQSFVHESGSLVNIKGDHIGKVVVGSEELYGYPAVRLYRNSLQQMLLAEAARLGIKIQYSMRAIRVQENEEDLVTVSFENGETVSADLVVGTDGTNSCVRETFAPSKELKYTGQVAIIGFAKNEDLRGFEDVRTARMILGTEGSFAMMPADGSGDTTLFFSTVETHDRTNEEWKRFIMDKQGLKDFLQDPFAKDNWPGIVRKLVQDTPADTFICWPFRRVPDLADWMSPNGRMIVAGDAAHAIPPSAAQGGSMGLEDSETLAITLSRLNGLPAASSALRRELLKKWEGHRKSRIEEVIGRTKAGSTMRKATRSEAAQLEKETALKTDTAEDNLRWLYGYDGRAFDQFLQ